MQKKGKTQFETYLEEEISKVKGISYPVKAGLLRRLLVNKLPCTKLHPNPNDEFCSPEIGPNYEILSRYEADYRRFMLDLQYAPRGLRERLEVEKIYPHGYMILNGHHRWAAASRAGMPWLRLGTPELIRELQAQGYEVWIYTSSFRSESYIRRLFRCYGIRLDGIVNGKRHMQEVQRDNKTTLPQKLPNRYRISLHIDDEAVICTAAGQYGFRAYQLDAEDDEWKEKILQQAERIRHIEHFDE